MGSKPFSLDVNDLKKVGTGLLVAIAGAAATYLVEWGNGTDFGSATPLVVAALSVLANTVRKWTIDNTPK